METPQYLKEKRGTLTAAAKSGNLVEFLRLAEMAARGLLFYFNPPEGAIMIGIGCYDQDNEIQVLCVTGPTPPTSNFLASTQTYAWTFRREDTIYIENSEEEELSVEEFLCELGGVMCKMAGAAIFCADPMPA